MVLANPTHVWSNGLINIVCTQLGKDGYEEHAPFAVASGFG